MFKTVCIGLGYRGRYLLQLLRRISSFSVVAVADPAILPEDIPGLECYNRGPDDYLRMLEEQRPDLAVIASPWSCHTGQACECLRHGCNVALEVGGGTGEGEYDRLLSLQKETGLRVYTLENIIFRKDIMSVRQMARRGLFGELVSMKGGYRHDLRDEIIDSRGVLGGDAPGSRAWRGKVYTTLNGDIYPTHSLAPLCFIGGVHSFADVTSFASKARGLQARLGASCPRITMGDVVDTEIRTPDGILISLVHDTTLPRPRGFGIEVQGTKGIWQADEGRLYFEGVSPFEQWEPAAPWVERYPDEAWVKWGAEATVADPHHEGMDYIMLKSLEQDLCGGEAYPASIEDFVLWTSVTPLSRRSIAENRTINL